MRHRGRRRIRCRTLGATALALGLFVQPAPSGAQVPDPEIATETSSVAARIAHSTFDAVILRPSGLAVLAAGAGLFIPAAWTTAFAGEDSVDEAFETFVTTPANYVFTRPLGEF